MRIVLVLLAALAVVPAPARAACSGPDPSIASVSLGHVSTSGGLSTYRFNGSVVNAGNAPQASNVLQFVDVFQAGEKANSIGIPPLHPHQSYAFSYSAQRSSDAGSGTTKLLFRLRMKSPAGSAQDCSAGNDSSTLTF
ncbi:MAG TPA: hypothetical protein VGK84_02470 [Candidatus Tumulicola sp.]|jgi:hypothetical protein